MGQVLKFAGFLLAVSCMHPVWADFDPTAPPKTAATAEATSSSTLSWVRVDGENSIAWYNGMVVKPGDRVEGGQIESIHEDHIVIAGKNGRRVVPLLDQQVRHQTAKQARTSVTPQPHKRKKSAHRD